MIASRAAASRHEDVYRRYGGQLLVARRGGRPAIPVDAENVIDLSASRRTQVDFVRASRNNRVFNWLNPDVGLDAELNRRILKALRDRKDRASRNFQQDFVC